MEISNAHKAQIYPTANNQRTTTTTAKYEEKTVTIYTHTHTFAITSKNCII